MLNKKLLSLVAALSLCFALPTVSLAQNTSINEVKAQMHQLINSFQAQLAQMQSLVIVLVSLAGSGNCSSPTVPSAASLTVSKNVNSPASRNIVADADGAINRATLLVFNIKASNSNITINRIDAEISMTGKYKAPTTAYLVDSADVVMATANLDGSNSMFSFADIDYSISKDTSREFTIKIDDNLAGDDSKIYGIKVNSAKIGAKDFNGAAVTKLTGTAQSNDLFAYKVAPIFILSSITTTSIQRSLATASRSAIAATYNIKVQASGGDIYIPKTGAFTVNVERGKTRLSGIPSITYIQPTGTEAGNNSYKISQDTTATFAVSANYTLKLTDGGSNYDLQMAGIDWNIKDKAAVKTPASTYMADDSNWESKAVFLY